MSLRVIHWTVAPKTFNVAPLRLCIFFNFTTDIWKSISVWASLVSSFLSAALSFVSCTFRGFFFSFHTVSLSSVVKSATGDSSYFSCMTVLHSMNLAYFLFSLDTTTIQLENFESQRRHCLATFFTIPLPHLQFEVSTRCGNFSDSHHAPNILNVLSILRPIQCFARSITVYSMHKSALLCHEKIAFKEVPSASTRAYTTLGNYWLMLLTLSSSTQCKLAFGYTAPGSVTPWHSRL